VAHGQDAAREAPARAGAPEQETQAPLSVESGIATVYAADMQGQLTASGEPYDPRALTGAHRSLPLGTRVRVVNPGGSRSVEVRINDRWGGGGGRVINLSDAAAQAAGFGSAGTVDVRLEVIALGDDRRAPASSSTSVSGSHAVPAPAAPRLAEVAPPDAAPLVRCQSEASILGLNDEFHARHVRTCLQRAQRAAARR